MLKTRKISNIKIPNNWSKGETIFSFLQWVRINKPPPIISDQSTRMIDPFYIDDDKLEQYYKEFLEYLSNGL